MQADVNERSKTLKTYYPTPTPNGTPSVWCKYSNFAKEKILKKSFLQVCCDYHSVFGLSFDAYIRACVRVKDEKLGIFSDV